VEPVANAAQSFDAKSWLDDADDWGDDANDWGDDAISDDPGRCRHKEHAKKAKKNNKTLKQAKAKPKPTKADNFLKIKPIKM